MGSVQNFVKSTIGIDLESNDMDLNTRNLGRVARNLVIAMKADLLPGYLK